MKKKNTKFDDFKAEIIKRAKECNACQSQFQRAINSTSFAELLQVIKDNFNYAVNKKVIDVDLLMSVSDEARECKIFVNESVTEGYLLAGGNATVEAWGNATVRAGGNATVRAWDNATVEAGGNATVEAGGNATVRAGDNATVEAWGNATVRAGGNATVRAWGNATVEAGGNATVRAWGNATVRAGGNATVEAGGNATVEAGGNATVRAGGNVFASSYYKIECKISDKAIYRCESERTITICKGLYTINIT